MIYNIFYSPYTFSFEERLRRAYKYDDERKKIEKSKKQYLIVGIGFNLIKSPNIPNYPATNLLEITNQ